MKRMQIKQAFPVDVQVAENVPAIFIRKKMFIQMSVSFLMCVVI